jgi:hypothetical protein
MIIVIPHLDLCALEARPHRSYTFQHRHVWPNHIELVRVPARRIAFLALTGCVKSPVHLLYAQMDVMTREDLAVDSPQIG